MRSCSQPSHHLHSAFPLWLDACALQLGLGSATHKGLLSLRQHHPNVFQSLLMPLQNKFGEQHSSHTSTHEHMHTEGQVIEERPVAVGVAEVRLSSPQ